MKLDNIGLVVFDIDGTLFNSVAFNVANMNRTLSEMGFSEQVDEVAVRGYLGCTAEDYYKGVLPESLHSEWKAIRTYCRENTVEMIKKHGKAFEGVYETFEALKKSGKIVVLYSNCSRMYLEAAVEQLGIKDLIDYAECVKDHDIPKPLLLKKLCDMFGDRRAVVVGDRIHDYEAAEINGIPCIGAMYGYGKEELEGIPYQVEAISDLLQII